MRIYEFGLLALFFLLLLAGVTWLVNFGLRSYSRYRNVLRRESHEDFLTHEVEKSYGDNK